MGREVHSQTLGEALDAPYLTWTSTGSAGISWSGQSGPTSTKFDSEDAAQSGAITHSQSTWFETTVIGPGTVSYWWKVSSCLENDEDGLKFYRITSGVTNLMASIIGVVNWNYRLFNVPAGTHTLRWSYEKDDAVNCQPDKGWVDQVIYGTNAPIPLETAVDTCGVTFTSGGNSNPTYWTGQTNVTKDGVDAVESGAVYGSASSAQESWMETTVTGATNVSFWWKVSSSPNQAVLEFYIGATKKAAITGEVNWSSNFFAFSGTQTLKWRYVKSDTIAGGSDRGWVDQIIISPPILPPTIASHPQPQTVPVGTNAVFSVSAGGAAPLAYQWRRNGVVIPGATTTELLFDPVQLAEEAAYSVTVSNVCGQAISSDANLTIAYPPAINSQPTNLNVIAGGAAVFYGDATGTPPFTYQWRHDGGDIAGATATVLELANVQAGDAGEYSLVVSNAYGDATSSNAALTVVFPPVIATQPTGRTAVLGSSAAFDVVASGTGPLVYQWQHNGASIGGATASAYTLLNLQVGDAGEYSVLVTNDHGWLTSSNALLVLLPPPILAIQLAGSDIALYWPLDYHDFGLEASPDIVTGGWTNVPAVTVTNGALIQTTLPPGNESLYYRLKQQ